MPVCLDRGTPEPTDDVQILKGDAWITVTSATEGASHVTAFTPAISDWNLRRAIATIFWVDAQWALPPSAVVDGGRPHVLTTTVSRRTDGAPLAGWLVRYDVGGGASLGYEGGNVVEVPTDAAGRASAEVSPANAGGGTTTVSITIIRPPQAGTDSSPRLEIGRGAASITWTTGISAPPAGASPFHLHPHQWSRRRFRLLPPRACRVRRSIPRRGRRFRIHRLPPAAIRHRQTHRRRGRRDWICNCVEKVPNKSQSGNSQVFK